MPEVNVYRGNDGGFYYFRGNFAVGENGRCGWFGYNPVAGWANVFLGRWILDGQVIKGMSGEWCDIPWGSYLKNGELAIDFHPGAPTPDWYRVSETGDFGGSTWTRTNSAPHFPGIPSGNRSFPTESLSGVWQTDKNEFYYMRELPSGMVFWFAIRPNLEIAHVARGRKQPDNSIRVSWLDIPPGNARSGGNLTLRVSGLGSLEKVSSTALFGSSHWTKLS